jgi:hypothetical protein
MAEALPSSSASTAEAIAKLEAFVCSAQMDGEWRDIGGGMLLMKSPRQFTLMAPDSTGIRRPIHLDSGQESLDFSEQECVKKAAQLIGQMPPGSTLVNRWSVELKSFLSQMRVD